MFLTKKAIPRRTFLKSAQAAMALPLLDAMIPAATAWASTPAKPVPRLGFVFIPMGCDHSRWTPPGQGNLDELTPSLTPLEPVKDQLTVITNMRLPNAYPGTHDTSNAAFLSSAFAKTHREFGLSSGHDGRPDRGPGDRPRYAVGLAAKSEWI